MALNATAQKLYDFAKRALPAWVKETDEFLHGAAASIGLAYDHLIYLFKQTLITEAEGATSTTPDWLAQHARDRDTGRQASETDPVLQERLRVIPDALTRQAILDAANAILDAQGVVGDAALVELPRDAAWAGVYSPMTGTGGTFVQSGTTSQFTPAVLPWPTPPYRAATVFPERRHQLVISGAANAGNNGTRTITGLLNNAAIVTNASGVAGVDATVTWSVRRLDGLGNVRDGFARSYAGRGWRATSGRPTIIVILPFGTSAGTQAAVTEAVRTKKATGIRLVVERRMNP